MIEQDILHKSQNYFSFYTEEKCRFVEFKTMKKNDPNNCQKFFTPYPSNKAKDISKGLSSKKDA